MIELPEWGEKLEKENIIISIIIVLCIAAAVAAYGITNTEDPIFSDLASMDSNDNSESGIHNNTNAVNSTNPTTTSGSSSSESDAGYSNSNGGESSSVSSSSDSSSSNGGNSENGNSGQYSDWQQDYETGDYDDDGNPIYRSVISTSGGQNEPGIYEAYWSSNGPISEERIG